MLTGNCHCGAARWTLEGDPGPATACNCNLCRRYGALRAYDYEGERINIFGPNAAHANHAGTGAGRAGFVVRKEAPMPDLDAEDRKHLPKSKFAEPEKRAYPIPDKAHARNAKARASQAAKAGRISKAEAARIDKKADKVLGKD